MRIISWNCRGLRKTTSVQHCKRLLSKFTTDLIYLFETKLPFEAVSSILNKLGYNKRIGTNAYNLGGGTIVAQQKDFQVNVIEFSDHVCHYKVSINESSPLYYLSFFYGPPKTRLHYVLWDWLDYITSTIHLPWLIIGDFNQVYHATDKSNAKGSSSNMAMFNNCMDRNHFHKIPQKGPRFTWTYNRKGKNLLLEKLDMAFSNTSWLEQFPLTHVDNEIISALDHSPIILTTTVQTQSKRQYKFEPYWYNFPDCLELIKTASTSDFRGSACFVLHNKLHSTLQALVQWSK